MQIGQQSSFLVGEHGAPLAIWNEDGKWSFATVAYFLVSLFVIHIMIMLSS
jgi:hypothetical protein